MGTKVPTRPIRWCLIQTLQYVSPQFHVVFDDWFETVTADADRTPPEWEELVNHSRFLNVLDNDVDP